MASEASAVGAVGVPAVDPSLADKISALKLDLKRIKQEKIAIQKTLRNSKKTAHRLRRRAAGLSCSDLQEILRQKKEAADSAGLAASSVSLSSSSSSPPCV